MESARNSTERATSSRLAGAAEAMARHTTAALGIVALGYFALMIVGVVRWYSPVPFWDMWDAYLATYLASMNGNWQAPLEQSNEHRIWVSSVLFHLDLTYFDGRSIFLLTVNAMLALAIWATLALIARHLLKDRPGLWIPVSLTCAILCFSWLQEQNLSWGFQSQFFVAYLFPLAAFACLAMSETSMRSGTWFAGAVLFGIMSAVTMANGILVLPLLAVMSCALPQPKWKRAGLLAVLALIVISTWFQGYYLVTREPAAAKQVAAFILTFAGLPFSAAFTNIWIVYWAGAIFVLAAGAAALTWGLERGKHDPMVLALLTFLTYVGASCAVIALGRAAVQSNAAQVSRYATPSLIAWCALILLFAYHFRRARLVRGAAVALGLVAAAGLLPVQTQVFGEVGPELAYRKMAAALALKLRVRDLEIISEIYPTNTPDSISQIFRVAREADDKGLSIMGDAALTASIGAIGKSTNGFHVCRGVVDEPKEIAGEEEYRRITGRLIDATADPTPPAVYFAKDGVIEGVAVVRRVRGAVVHAGVAPVPRGGFTGYLRASAAGSPLHTMCLER